MKRPWVSLLCSIVLLACGARASAQLGNSRVVVVPQERVYDVGGTGSASGLRIERIRVLATIVDQVASTNMGIELRNDGSWDVEAEIVLPVPDGAVVKAFEFEGSASESSVQLLERGEARALYDSIVSRTRDPALLEFAGCAALRSSVFPVPAGGRQRVMITWDQVLPAHGDRIDYLLPRSEAFAASAIPWEIGLHISSRSRLATIWSPTSELLETRLAPNVAFVRLAGGPSMSQGPVQVSFLQRSAGISTSVLACPDQGGDGGYLLLLGGVPELSNEGALRREVTLVLDRSGSMRGEKFAQALEAARQIVEGLHEGEAFQIIDYSDDVASFAPAPVALTPENLEQARTYLSRLSAQGGTNLNDALQRAVTQPATEGLLPVVLFLTDGLATSGICDEARIRDATAAANGSERRLFTFGVGTDVNAPLLDALASQSRATSTYVLPDEDVEVKVGEVYRRLYGPVLSNPVLTVLEQDGTLTTQRLKQILPARVPDLFAGDQLLISARYYGEAPLQLVITGAAPVGPMRLVSEFDPAQASRDQGFVARLWADRRIGELVDEARLAGAAPGVGSGAAQGAISGGAPGAVQVGGVPADPRLDELVHEIVALSTEFGVLSEYTAFMATQGADFWNLSSLNQRVRAMVAGRAQKVRTGRGAVSQAVNISRMRRGRKGGRMNAYLDANLNTIQLSGVRTVDDVAFFSFEGRWFDSRIVLQVQQEREAKAAAAASAQATGATPSATPSVPSTSELLAAQLEVVDFGTPAWERVVGDLEAEGHAGVLGLPGSVFVMVGGKRVLLRAAPKPNASPQLPAAVPADVPSPAAATGGSP